MKSRSSIQLSIRWFILVGMAVLVWSAASATAWLAAGSVTKKAESETAIYHVVFTATWRAETHPHPSDNFPTASAHFSPLIGAMHQSGVSFWTTGGMASEGIEQMVESGGTSKLRAEINDAIADGTALAEISGGGPTRRV